MISDSDNRRFLYLYEKEDTLRDKFTHSARFHGDSEKRRFNHTIDGWSSIAEDESGIEIDFISYESFIDQKKCAIMYIYDTVFLLDEPDFNTLKEALAIFLLSENSKIRNTDIDIPYIDKNYCGQSKYRTLPLKRR